MTNLITTYDIETGVLENREMTEQEINQSISDAEAIQARKAEEEAKVAAKQAILDRLGLTAEEAALLIK